MADCAAAEEGGEAMTSATTGHAAEAPLDLEIFQAGTFADGVTFTEADIDALISNTKALAARGCKVPLVVGHREHGTTPRQEQPAIGWLVPESLRRAGDKLLGTFTDIAPIARKAIERKLYRSASVELLPDVARSNVERHLNTGLTGPAVLATAVLGSTLPKCRGLADLDVYLHADDEAAAWHDGPAVFKEHQPADGEAGQVADGIAHKLADGLSSLATAMQAAHQLKSRYPKTPADDVVADDTDEGETDNGEPSVKQRLARAEQALNQLLRQRAALAARQQELLDSADATVAHGERRSPALSADFLADLESAERMMAALQERGQQADEVAERMKEKNTMRRFDETASGNPFAPPNAEDGPLGDVFLTEVEGRIRERGWDRNNIDERRKAAREILSEWRYKSPSPSAGDADNLADQLNQLDFERAILGNSPTADTRAASGWNRPGMTTLNYAEKDDPPLYGTRARIASEMGGAGRLQRLEEIAREKGLRLTRTADRALAMAELGREEGATVRGAATFEDAVAGVIREQSLTFSEADQARAGLEALRRRPDLAPQYGTRGRPAPEENARAIALRENAMEELRSIPIDVKDRVAIAWRNTAARHKNLCPSYGWTRRRA